MANSFAPYGRYLAISRGGTVLYCAPLVRHGQLIRSLLSLFGNKPVRHCALLRTFGATRPTHPLPTVAIDNRPI